MKSTESVETWPKGFDSDSEATAENIYMITFVQNEN